MDIDSVIGCMAGDPELTDLMERVHTSRNTPPAFGEWISVRERLPDNQREVIGGIEHEWAGEAKYDERWGWVDGAGCRVKVTHWMKMPLPPTEANIEQG